MRETVHKIVEVELGGPVSAPSEAAAPPAALAETPAPTAAGAAPAAPPSEPAHDERRVLKVDVVGLNNGTQEQQVRAAFNGNTDLRFFDPDTQAGYAPHRGRHCIMLTHRVPHALKAKIKAARVDPIYVRPTVGHVVHAIEELHRASGTAA